MGFLYMVKVQEGDEVYEYEFDNLKHVKVFMSSEKQPKSLWLADTVTGKEPGINLEQKMELENQGRSAIFVRCFISDLTMRDS